MNSIKLVLGFVEIILCLLVLISCSGDPDTLRDPVTGQSHTHMEKK